MRRLVNNVLRKTIGSELNDVSRVRDSRNGWEQYRFIKPDGSFDYEQYRSLQVAKAVTDTDTVWCKEDVIAFLADYLQRRMGKIRSGLCHGSKKGQELEWFMKHLGGDAHVMGTDISPLAKLHPNMIEWDYHEVKPEWRNAFDFIYSNALDHSYDPEKAVNAWMSCVRPGGHGIIEWHVHGEALNITDPFAADVVQLVYQITRWCRGDYGIREVISRADNADLVSIILYRFTTTSPLKPT